MNGLPFLFVGGKVYDRHLYRCYRRISSPTSCEGPSAYEMDPIHWRMTAEQFLGKKKEESA